MSNRAQRPAHLRIRSSGLLLPAWFSPSSSLRTAFHRARGVCVGDNVEIGYFVLIDNLYPELVTIEDEATIAAKTTILAHDESLAYTQQGGEKLKPVRIGRGAFVGVDCVILPGVTIGEHAIVGAGSVVTSDIPPYSVVAGVPARELRRLRSSQ